ncbi:hypothetical protein OV079_50155 [Nannocystis pusilla]|uniref:Uncharacterized protein n=1 Tax=Nannocystis pusilla TaxID=889268 RepID=A0A9X3F050_9BACT|nr:hypothetical protein [Nannocystis pusilla]MCY1013562.1 hypothetical protein [Nannocystis pusilla]
MLTRAGSVSRQKLGVLALLEPLAVGRSMYEWTLPSDSSCIHTTVERSSTVPSPSS